MKDQHVPINTRQETTFERVSKNKNKANNVC